MRVNALSTLALRALIAGEFACGAIVGGICLGFHALWLLHVWVTVWGLIPFTMGLFWFHESLDERTRLLISWLVVVMLMGNFMDVVQTRRLARFLPDLQVMCFIYVPFAIGRLLWWLGERRNRGYVAMPR